MPHEVKKRRQAVCLLITTILVAAWADAVSAGEASTWSVLPSRADDEPGFTFTPSPDDWRDLSIYQVITDRFIDGDPANNSASPGGLYNPLVMDGIHGGDFAGLTVGLDYIRYLGFDAIWISPVYLNHRGAYHGYHISDFNRIDPHWGTLAELRRLVDEAHARGMRVILDVVFNHMARMTTSDDPGFPAFSQEPYRLRWMDATNRFAPPFDDLALFHAHGSIGNWENFEENIIGDLRGLADLRTEDLQVKEWLLDMHAALIAATDCDGFRVDTVHHVELDFWQYMIPRIEERAAALGKTNFLIFAESLRHRDDAVSILTREGGFPSALYYPYFFTLQEVWGRRGPTRLLAERWWHLPEYGPAWDRLVTFADNHDRERLLNDAYLAGDIRRLRAVLALLYATPGTPCVYYGTEQAFRGSKGHSAREPMFDPTVPGQPDRLDASSPLSRWIRMLNHLRRDHEVLRRGGLDVLYAEDTAGLFAFTRTNGNERAVVVINNSTVTRKLEKNWFGGPEPEEAWIDALTGERMPDAGAEIHGDTTQIWMPAAHYQPPPPSVVAIEPPHGAMGVGTDSVFRITFDLPVEQAVISVNGQPVARTDRDETRTRLTAHPDGLPSRGWTEWSVRIPPRPEIFTARFHIGGAEVRSRHPLAAFRPDGQLDSIAMVAARHGDTSLFVAYDEWTGMLYLATRPAGPEEDRFIMLAFSDKAGDVRAPWEKDGKVPAYDILICDEGESDYTAVRGTDRLHWSAGRKDGVLEAAIQIGEPGGDFPETIYLRTATYGTRDNGPHISDGDLPAEGRRLELETRRFLVR